MDFYINSELCKPIPDFNRYHISESGRVYRTKPVFLYEERLLSESEHDILVFHEVKPSLSYGGNRYRQYLRCGLKHNNGKLTMRTIANLVILSFGLMPKRKIPYFRVVHIDGDISNCHINNLKIVQQQPNHHILKKEDIPQIRKLIHEGCTLRDIARQYGVCEMQIQRIKTGENWAKRRMIFPKKLPFEVKDPKIRRLLTYFEESKLDNPKVKSPFIIRRDKNDGTNNVIVGRINGYRFKNKHKNISRAREIVDKLNRYFFSDSIADRYTQKLNVGMHKNIEDLSHRTRISH